VTTQKIKWRRQWADPCNSGSVNTAGGLLFVGRRDGRIQALDKRNGGSVWVAGSYDAALNLVYFGVAQTYDTGPYRDLVVQSGVTNDLLYTDSTVAINPDTGKVVWHFQHQPNDQWDFDWAFGRLIFKMPVGGTTKTVVATSGKQAIYDVVEADTGKYVTSMDLGLQDVVLSVDPRTVRAYWTQLEMPMAKIST